VPHRRLIQSTRLRPSGEFACLHSTFIMVREPYSPLEQAVIIFFNSKLCHDDSLCLLLKKIAKTDRTIQGVRSQLSKLKNESTLYDKRTKMWTPDALRTSVSERMTRAKERLPLI
jgi:hypothetical protein